MEAKRTQLQMEIKKYHALVLDYQETENKWVEEIKFLSTIREKMARTASQAMA